MVPPEEQNVATACTEVQTTSTLTTTHARTCARHVMHMLEVHSLHSLSLLVSPDLLTHLPLRLAQLPKLLFVGQIVPFLVAVVILDEVLPINHGVIDNAPGVPLVVVPPYLALLANLPLSEV